MMNQPDQPSSTGGTRTTPAVQRPVRRRVLGLGASSGAALAGALLVTGRRTKRAAAQTAASVVGSWVITFPQGNGQGSDPNEHQLISFTGDGIMISSSNPSTPPDPRQGPGSTRIYSTVGQGVWVAADAGQARFTFTNVATDERGKFVNLLQISGTLTLGPDGNSLTGSFHVRGTDATGAVLFESPEDSGTIQGTRITV